MSIPFWKRFMIQKALRKKFGYIRIIPSPTYDAYSLSDEKIVIPFDHRFDLQDYYTLVRFAIARNMRKFSVPMSYITYTQLLNILEDWIVAKDVDLSRIAKKVPVFKVKMIPHLDEREAKEIIEKLQQTEVLKNDFDVDEIYERFMKAFENRDAVSEIRHMNGYILEQYLEVWNIQNVEVGDGPTPYCNSFRLPDWEFKREIDKIIRNIITPSVDTIVEEKMFGKKINRKFLFHDACIKPFKHSHDIVQVNKPRIAMIFDCSGSMEDFEHIGKALAMSFLEHLGGLVVMHNEYFTRIVRNPDGIVRVPCTGDERFDKLPEKITLPDHDVLIVFTDLIISNDELQGLNEIIRASNAKIKRVLCVNRDNLDAATVCKIVDATSKEEITAFLKRLQVSFQ